jgi:leader peptidase (prepilin peptidase)/N-methyltransferase
MGMVQLGGMVHKESPLCLEQRGARKNTYRRKLLQPYGIVFLPSCIGFGLAALALCVGSFIAVVVIRMPEGRSPLRGRSRCDHCGSTLTVADLVPLLSWLLLRGRCRQCGSRVSTLYPATEALAAIIALWGLWICEGWAVPAAMLLGWQLLALALIDARTMLLPRTLTLGLMISGLTVSAATSAGWPLDQIAGAALGFFSFRIIALVYRRLRGREGMGMGDAKLLAGLGAWVGWEGLPTVTIYATLAALLYLAGRNVCGERIHAATALPFGPFLALGGWLVWLYGPFILQASSR